MNRRDLLLGLVASAVAVTAPAVEATATWRELHDGTPFDLGDGDWTIEMWFRTAKPGFTKLLLDGPQDPNAPTVIVDASEERFSGHVADFSLRIGSEEARKMLERFGLAEFDAFEVMEFSIEKYKSHVPDDQEWHHLRVRGGRVFVDGEERLEQYVGFADHVDHPDSKFGRVSGGLFDGTGDYFAVPE